MIDEQTRTTAPDQERTTEPMQVPPPGQKLQPAESAAEKQRAENQATEGQQQADEKQHQKQASAAAPSTRVHADGPFMRLLTSPWLLITVPLIAGGVWLANNPGIITNNLDKPYALLAGPALVGSFLGLWLVINFFKTIANWCRACWFAFLKWRKQEGSTFWLVIAIFLTVSVFESGAYFNGLLGSNDLFGTLGYASAFVIDLVSVECMRARLGAVRMRDKAGKRLYLLGVIACAGLSAWANTYTALKHFSEPTSSPLPHFMIVAAPWTGMAFPLLIIFLSFTADYTADQTSAKLNPEAYKESEQKRITLLEIQRDMLRQRVAIEHEIDSLSYQLNAKKEKRVFFLINWLFPVRTPQIAQPVDTQVLAEGIQKSLIDQLTPWFQYLDEKYHLITTTTQQQFSQTFEKYQSQVQHMIANTDADVELLVGQVKNIHSSVELLRNSVSTDTPRDQIGRRGKGNASASVKRETKKQEIGNGTNQIFQKSLNFKPNACHQKAVEFLRNFSDRATLSDDIQRLGYEWLATQIRQEPDLNFAFVTPVFASETWALYQLEAEKQPDGEGDSPSPQDTKKEAVLGPTEEIAGNGEAEVNQHLEPVESGEAMVNLHQNSSPIGEGSPVDKQATGEGSFVKTEQAASEESNKIRQPNAFEISEKTVNSLTVSEEQLGVTYEAQQPSNSDDNSEIIPSQHGNENEAVLPNIAEIPSEELQISQNISETDASNGQISDTTEQISPSETSVEEKYHDNSEGQEEISEPASGNRRPHGPHSLSIEEVAIKFDTTVTIIEQAISDGVLKLSKRGNRKVLVSSLEGFSPARKPGRRPAQQKPQGQSTPTATNKPVGQQAASARTRRS